MMLYIENPKDTTRKLLELINESGKVAEYKINIQKSVALLYTNNERWKTEIKETIPFTTASKRIKYLEINLLKEQKTCTLKTVRHWWKKLKMTQTDGEISHVLGLEESALSKWLYYPRQSTDSIQWHFSQN